MTKKRKNKSPAGKKRQQVSRSKIIIDKPVKETLLEQLCRNPASPLSTNPYQYFPYYQVTQERT